MEAVHKNGRHLPKILGLCFVVCLITVLFLLYPDIISSGASTGLSLCSGVLIPSLFPFMVLSSFALYSGADYPIVRLLGKGTVKLLRLPARSVSIFLFSLLGGYPIGPKLIASAVERGELNEHQAQRMLSFCSNAGPAFVVSAVGFGILGNNTAGLILLGAQVSSALIIALGSSLFEKNRPAYRPMKPSSTPVSLSFVKAVTDSASAMMALCAFVVVFAVILRMMDGFGVFSTLASILHLKPELVTAVVSGFLEVTSGCKAAAACGGMASILLCCLFTAFSGLSVLFQVRSILQNVGIRFGPYLLSKFLHCALSTGLVLLFFQLFPPVANVFGPSQLPLTSQVRPFSFSALTTILFFLACLVLIAGAGRKKSPRFLTKKRRRG